MMTYSAKRKQILNNALIMAAVLGGTLLCGCGTSQPSVDNPYIRRLNVKLLKATRKGDMQQMRHLLDQGADVNALLDGQAVLHHASKLKYAGPAEVLIASGADVDIRNTDGLTPLHYAVIHNSPAVVEVLLGNGAKTNLQDHGRRTPLELARRKKRTEIVILLEAAE